jgi:hypothetical protein
MSKLFAIAFAFILISGEKIPIFHKLCSKVFECVVSVGMYACLNIFSDFFTSSMNSILCDFLPLGTTQKVFAIDGKLLAVFDFFFSCFAWSRSLGAE